MDVINTFVLDGTTHVVHMIWEDGEPLFKASDVAKVLGIVDVSTSIKRFQPHEKAPRTVRTLGGAQSTTFLTEPATYKLINRSRKPVAERFQNWVSEVIVSIRKTGSYRLKDLEEEVDALRKTVEEKENAERAILAALEATAKQQELTKQRAVHDALVSAYGKRPLVYIGNIRPEGDRMLIKIGSTVDLGVRAQSLVQEFGSMTIFEVFECVRNRDFEAFLQKHSKIKPLRYNDDIVPNRRSNGEVFLVDPADVETIVHIAKYNRYRFDDAPTRQDVDAHCDKEIELERLRLERAKVDSGDYARDLEIELERLRLERFAIEHSPPPAPIVCPPTTIIVANTRRYTQGRGPKIQLYTADGKELVKTYLGYKEAERDDALDAPKHNMIRQAIAERSIYKNHRWAALDRKLPDDTVQEIGGTLDHNTSRRRHGLVAMLNLDKTNIVEVFGDQREAAKDRKFKSGASICNSMLRGRPSGGHVFMMWYDCPQDLKDAYLERVGSLPLLPTRGNGKAVEKLDAVTEEVVERFSAVEHVKTKYKMSRTTLFKAIEDNEIRNGYKWRFAG